MCVCVCAVAVENKGGEGIRGRKMIFWVGGGLEGRSKIHNNNNK